MIKKYFIPTIYIKNYRTLNLEKLREHGIKVLCIDVDNTLVPPHTATLDNDAIAFIQRVKDNGLLPVIISNNTEKRVQGVANQVNVDFYSFSCKPCKYNYIKILRDTKCTKNEVAVLGDQLVTDILGGNRMNFLTILQDPISDVENTSGKITRRIETKILATLSKNESLKKGTYYDNM